MMISNIYLLIFAVAFMGCVLATPVVTRLAIQFGAIDRPDQFRRIHKGATPRMGGLGLAFGLTAGLILVVWGGYLRDWIEFDKWWANLLPIAISGTIVLLIGAVDDLRGIGPRVKLVGQALAALVLYLGGIRIGNVSILNIPIRLDYFSFTIDLFGHHQTIAILSLIVTLFWFLACMNIWNLIDGMDGLASGVGLLVSGTLMLVAIRYNNNGVAFLAASLAGSLAGFLLYNWHPACIFLGDSGSLLIGLLIGVIGIQGSFKATSSAISILIPILAMGLPISDTALAIFRRWVRNLPLSSADRRHVHHLLIGLGLNPRWAAVALYILTAFLCGVVLLGVAFQAEFLALVVGISGCLAFLLILTSRRNELAMLRADFLARMSRGKQERFAAKVTWEAIQRIELCETIDGIWSLLEATTATLGCDGLKIECRREGKSIVHRESGSNSAETETSEPLSGPTATFRLTSGQDQVLTVSFHQPFDGNPAADIAFRFMQRLSLATSERLERLLDGSHAAAGVTADAEDAPADIHPRTLPVVSASTLTDAPETDVLGEPLERPLLGRLRTVLQWPAATVHPQHTLGEK